MLSKNNKWLALGLASLVLSGCSINGTPNLNLGFRDSFQKVRASLFKQKLGYERPQLASNPFGFGGAAGNNASPPVAVPGAFPEATGQSFTGDLPASDCGCIASPDGVVIDGNEFYMPGTSPTVMTEYDTVPYTSSPDVLMAPSLEIEGVPFENAVPIANPLPGAENDIDIDLDEERGIIESLDSASNEKMQPIAVEPEEDEKSVLESARNRGNRVPTNMGDSIVDQRPKIVTLTARPAESHHLFDAAKIMEAQQETALATHKRTFRTQNSLRRSHTNFPAQAYEHTAEALPAMKFKSLPKLPQEQTRGTGKNDAPRLKKLDDTKDTDGKHYGTLKTARLPLLKATTISTASITALRSFTNVRESNHQTSGAGYQRRATTLTAEVVDDHGQNEHGVVR